MIQWSRLIFPNSRCRDLKLAEDLIKEGADVNLCPLESTRKRKVPPLYYATAAHDAEIVRLLLNSGNFFLSQDVLLACRDEVGINDLILYIDHRLASVLCFLRNILITISNYYKSNYTIWYMYVLFRTNKIFNMIIQIVMFYVWIFCLTEIFQIGFHLPIRNLVNGI